MTVQPATAGVFRRFGPLLFLIGIELVWCVYLALTRAIPIGHDAFQYFYVKYYFFNDFVRNGEVAQWLPYLTHGSPGAWWYIVQSGIFDPIALFVARVLKLTDFFPLFYGLLFVEKLLLILGTWLLAAEHLKTRSAIFAVTAAVILTSIWYTQAWWNFHAIMPLPLMLFCVHRSYQDFAWRWPIGLSLALYLQTFGNLSYYLPMTLLFVALYAALIATHADARAALRARFRFSWLGVLAVIGVNAAFLLELLWLKQAAGEIVYGSSQRGANGAVSFSTFLDYAGPTDLRAWNQFFSGVTPHLDFTLFAGFLVPGLLVLTFFGGPLNRTQRLFAMLAGVTVLVGTASPLATAVFYAWPLGGLFRHLALLAPAAKFFCVFLAGASLERLTLEPGDSRAPTRRLVALTAISGFWFVLFVVFAIDPASLQSFVAGLTTGGLPSLHANVLRLAHAQLVRGALFLPLTWVVLVLIVRARGSSSRTLTRWSWAAAVLLLLDAASYGYLEMRERTIALSAREAAIFNFTDLPYATARRANPDAPENARRWIFAKSEARLEGTRYWAEDLLWLNDSYQTSQRTVYWSSALDALVQALHVRDGETSTGIGEILAPAYEHPLVSRIAGYQAPKVRLFSRAIVCDTINSATAVLVDSRYRGQVALLVAPALSLPRSLPCTSTPIDEPGATPGSARVTGYTSNRVELEVTNPTADPLVMTYSDAWSPHWLGYIDSEPAAIMRSDLAYKAVIVPPGSHHVSFEYRDRMAQAVVAAQSLASVGFLVFLLFLVRWTTAALAGEHEETARVV